MAHCTSKKPVDPDGKPAKAPPPAQGALADWLGVQHSFLLPMAYYAFVLWYGVRFARLTDRPGART